MFLSAFCTSAFAVDRLSVPGVAVTVALRSPRSVVTVAGPLVWATDASVSRATGPAAVGTFSAERAATVVGGLSLWM